MVTAPDRAGLAPRTQGNGALHVSAGREPLALTGRIWEQQFR